MSDAPRTIETARLLLRAWCEEDAPELRALLDANDAHLRPWIPFMRHEPRDLDGTRLQVAAAAASFAAGEHLRYGVRERAGGRLVGEVMLIGRGPAGSMEVGYWLDERATGGGYATEAARALKELAFGPLGLDFVLLRCDLRNGPSIAVAERLGGRRVAVDRLEEDGAWIELGTWRVDRP